jgi:transcriptional regulator with XRE-family HTH domain
LRHLKRLRHLLIDAGRIVALLALRREELHAKHRNTQFRMLPKGRDIGGVVVHGAGLYACQDRWACPTSTRFTLGNGVPTVLLPGLRAARKRARLTQVVLAERAFLSAESVCRFELQRRPASLDAAKRLAQVLSVPVEALDGNAQLCTAMRARNSARLHAMRQPKAGRRVCANQGDADRHHGRCRVCRARLARERYWADTLTREKKKARVRRNYWRRKASVTADSSRDVGPN